MPSVSEWYSGKRVLVTGATGFMGKVLLEKLLRSCQNISTIYLLIRPKREKSPQQRLDEFTYLPVSSNRYVLENERTKLIVNLVKNR